MTTKDKVRAIVMSLIDGVVSEAGIIEHSGHRLTEADVARFYGPAERVLLKARNKAEKPLSKEELVAEAESWLNFFEWD